MFAYGTFETSRDVRSKVANGGKRTLLGHRQVDPFDPTETLGRALRKRGSEPIRQEDRNVAEFKPEQ
jgi:hypothetical protein